LPKVFLLEPRPQLAHVAPYGLVCVDDGQGLSIDTTRRVDVTAHTVLSAYDLLERSADDAAAGNHEFFNELEGYWGGFVLQPTYSLVEVDGRSRVINAFIKRLPRAQACPFLTEQFDQSPSEFNTGGLSRVRGLYLALSQYPLTPAPGEPFEVAHVLSLLNSLGAPEKALWEAYLKSITRTKPIPVCLLLSVPRTAGGCSLVGLLFSVKQGQIDQTAVVRPLSVQRHTATYMRERGGANPAMAKRHVVVFGCGSVGSEAADALASSGVGQLTLVDPDMHMHDNVFRHVLGRDAIDKPKVSGLREELKRKYPGLAVNTATIEAQSWLDKSSLADVDGILVAIGQPTLERELYRKIKARGRSLPVVFTWLEPLDLGGHTFMFQTDRQGCLDCLYRNDEGEPSLYLSTAFLADGQKVTRNLTGCASIFVPYGAIQSRRTALLAAEQLLGALDGKPGPAYDYWVGEGLAAQREGLRTSPWWAKARATSGAEVTKHLFAGGCSTCRSKK
jgi:hypothetical protein